MKNHRPSFISGLTQRPEMLPKYPPNLFDRLRLALATVSAAHDQLRLNTRNVGTGVRDDTVIAFWREIGTFDGDDGMRLNGRAHRDLRKGEQGGIMG